MFNYRPNLTWNIHYSPAARPGIHLTLFGAYLAVRNVKIVNYNFRNFFLQEQTSLKKTKSEIIIKKNLIHFICKCQIFFMPFKPAIISNLYSPIPTHNKMDEKKSLWPGSEIYFLVLCFCLWSSWQSPRGFRREFMKAGGESTKTSNEHIQQIVASRKSFLFIIIFFCCLQAIHILLLSHPFFTVDFSLPRFVLFLRVVVSFPF